MRLLIAILHLIPGEILENIYYSKLGNILTSLYDLLTKRENLRVHRIFHDLLMEVDLSKPVERAIPFEAYEPAITKKFLDIVKQGSIVFDVGAWIGYHTLLAARKAEKVVAIEPDPINCQRIKKNLDLNNFSNVTILNMAVGNRSSSGVLLEAPISPMNRIVQQGIGNAVRIEPLDDIIAELKIHKIDLIMMDIQGYEYFAIQGLQKSLSNSIIRNLICEIHPRELKQNGVTDNDVIDILSKYRYEINKLKKTEFSDDSVYYIYAKPMPCNGTTNNTDI